MSSVSQKGVMHGPPDLSGSIPTTRQINTTNSLTGGGDLSANRTISLVGDVASPGNNQVYGTDAAGNRVWKPDPAGSVEWAGVQNKPSTFPPSAHMHTDTDAPATVLEVTGASRTLALADRGLYLRWTAAGAKTLTVNAATGGENGEYHCRNAAASGNLTFVASGVTINAPAGGTLVLEPRMTVTLKRVGTNVFDLFGQTVAA